MIETFIASVVLAICTVLLIRQCLPHRWQEKFDAAAQTLAHLPTYLSRKKRSTRDAAQAIQRAKEAVARDGNVYHPKSFKGPRKPH